MCNDIKGFRHLIKCRSEDGFGVAWRNNTIIHISRVGTATILSRSNGVQILLILRHLILVIILIIQADIEMNLVQEKSGEDCVSNNKNAPRIVNRKISNMIPPARDALGRARVERENRIVVFSISFIFVCPTPSVELNGITIFPIPVTILKVGNIEKANCLTIALLFREGGLVEPDRVTWFIARQSTWGSTWGSGGADARRGTRGSTWRSAGRSAR
jgi:hypothetical protein